MARTLSLGLGGLFRQLYSNEQDIVSAYPLSEIVKATARDIAYDKNPGVWVNTGGCTRGTPVDIPEGALGCLFDGDGYVRVPNDGAGYRIANEEGPRTLSCAGGDIDVPFMFKTSTDDATLRAIAQKQNTNSSGIGWHVALVNGAVQFTLITSGGTVFSFQRGAVDDDVLHLGHCTYDSVAGEARIFIDGAQVGATVSVTPEDPEFSSGDFRIAAFNDAVPGDGFIGVLCYVGIGRNGNPGLSALLQAARAWTDVSAHVRAEDIELVNGMSGSTLRDRHAGIGTLSWTMDNGVKVTEGTYAIGHASARAGFDLGIPVKWTVDGLIRFRGRLMQADPEAGVYKGHRVFCMAADWMEAAARTSVTAIPILLDARSDEAWAALVDEAEYPPVAVSIVAGSESFPFFGDAVSGPMLAEMAKVVASEGGYAYMRPDSTTGGVLTFEGRGVRQLDTTPDATFDGTMRGLAVEIGEAAIVNVARSTFAPREAGALATDILYRQDRRQSILPGQTVIVEGRYQDPDQSRSAVGGTDFQPFTAGTDYTFRVNEDGTGDNMIGDLTVMAEIGGSGFRIAFTNTSTVTTGWFDFQIRGRALYTDHPMTVIEQDGDSVRARGARYYNETYAYLDSAATARALAQLPLSLFAAPTRIPSALKIGPTPSAPLLAAMMPRTVGDLIAIGEPVTGMVTSQRYWIQNERWVYSAPDLAEVTFGVFPSFSGGDVGFGAWDDTYWDDSLWGF